jgi:hypothetical protein
MRAQMRRWAPALVGVATLALAVACGSNGGGGGTTTTSGGGTSPGSPTSGAGVPAVDACKLLSDQDLTKAGAKGPGVPSTVSDQVGCDYQGEAILMTLAVDQKKNLDGYKAGASNYSKFTENKVNGRRGAVLEKLQSSPGCTQLLELGKGLFVVDLQYSYGHSGDACAEAERIATQVVEPKLPR